MFSKKRLKRFERKKRNIVARSDLYRESFGQMLSVTERVGQIKNPGNGVHPTVTTVSKTALLYLKARYLPGKRYLAPVFSLAGIVLEMSRRVTPGDQSASGAGPVT